MDVIYNVAEYGATLFDAVAPIAFLTILFGRNKRMKRGTYYICMVLMTFLNVAVVFLLEGKDILQAAAMVMFEWLYSVCLLEGKGWKKLIYVLMYDIILSIASMVIVYGMAYVFSLELDILMQFGTLYRVVTLICNKIFIIVLLFMVILMEKKGKPEYREWKIAVCGYAAVIMAELSIVRFTKQQNFVRNTTIELMFWSTLAIIAIGVTLAVCIYRLDKQYHFRLENEVLEAKLYEEKYMLQKIDEMYEDNQILRHDLRRYLTIAQGMVKNNEIDTLRKYLEEVLGEHFEAKQIYHTDSSVVNAVLNDKANICKKNHIQYNVTASGKIGGRWQIDIGIILSNLIDNAIEAELKEERGRIDVQILPCKKMLQIRVANYISRPVLKDNPRLRTWKKDSESHGIGTKSVKKMVEKMDGICLYEEKENYFIATILLPDDANCA